MIKIPLLQPGDLDLLFERFEFRIAGHEIGHLLFG